MPEGEDWLWRPVSAGLCDYIQIIDGTLDLGDVRTMNNILDVREENERRANEHYERTRPRLP